MKCYIACPSESGIESKLNCYLSIKKGVKISYDNLYLLPYYFINKINNHFGIIIKDIIKEDPTRRLSTHSKISYTFIVFFILLF